MAKIKSAKINYATPGKVLEKPEFEQMIKKAESEPFHTIKEVKAELEKWKLTYRDDL